VRQSPRDAERWSLVSPQPGKDEFLSSRSERHLRVLGRLRRYARQADATILLEGESGTGKSYLARQIHALSPRAGGPYHEVSLSALDDNLSGADLFGHSAGAFTDAKHHRAGAFVSANGGTLFLDEIGKASFAVQRKLLHVLEDGTLMPYGTDRSMRVDVRVVAATNVPLEELVREGSFLPDLAPRLGLFRVRLVPLRERPEDIPALATSIVERRAPRCGYRTMPRIDECLLNALRRAEWPLNVRQLDATLHRVLVDAEGAPVLGLEHCLDDLEYLRSVGQGSRQVTPEQVKSAVGRHSTRAATAEELGISPATLYRRLAAAREGSMSGRAD
jgi:DNA-binding NtrC family response regulator